MCNFKVSSRDTEDFIITESYRKLYTIFKKLKVKRNMIVHVLGAPGTGKSTNIYHAIKDLDLNVYNVKLDIPKRVMSSKEIFDLIFEILMADLQLAAKKDIYKQLSEFDMVLIADDFHDSYRQNPEVMGFSQWTDIMGFKAFPFYIYCIWEYLKHRSELHKINLVFQTSWRIYINGEKKDLFTDLGLLSKLFVTILRGLFTIVEISYTEEETKDIVKRYIPEANEDVISFYIQKYGYKPRFICDILKKNIKK